MIDWDAFFCSAAACVGTLMDWLGSMGLCVAGSVSVVMPRKLASLSIAEWVISVHLPLRFLDSGISDDVVGMISLFEEFKNFYGIYSSYLSRSSCWTENLFVLYNCFELYVFVAIYHYAIFYTYFFSSSMCLVLYWPGWYKCHHPSNANTCTFILGLILTPFGKSGKVLQLLKLFLRIFSHNCNLL